MKHLKVMTVGFFTVGLMLTNSAMAKDSSIEKRLQTLEESTASLQKELTRAQDILAIQTLQGRYEAVHNSDESLSYAFFCQPSGHLQGDHSG
jgi:ABC-type phosphate transport system auxiliary subunit